MRAPLALAGLGECLQVATWLVAALLVPAVAAAVGWIVFDRSMQRERWMRSNYRGLLIVGVSGLIVIGVVVAAWPFTLWAFLADAGAEALPSVGGLAPEPLRTPRHTVLVGALAVLVLTVGFGWLGYRDDTRGEAQANSADIAQPDSDPPARSGFVGHLRASLRRRRLTTGMAKALGGALVALAAVQLAARSDPGGIFDWVRSGPYGWSEFSEAFGRAVVGHPRSAWGIGALVRGALVVALGANLLNLLDRAPGRATKAALVWWLAVIVPAGLSATVGGVVVGPGLVPEHWVIASGTAVGASAGLLRSELHEKHMLGDTGVNPVGALLGMATVAVFSPAATWAISAVLAGLNLASERWSFSRVIDAVAPLRWLDRFGSPYRRF